MQETSPFEVIFTDADPPMTSRCVNISITDDALVEGDGEEFQVLITGVSNVMFGQQAFATVRIEDNDDGK